jgi:hypothetical protein
MNNPLISTSLKPAHGSMMAAAIGLLTAYHPLLQAEEDLRAKTQNPIGSLIAVPLENNFDFGADNGEAYILSIQPIIPVRVGDWNLINRIIAPVIRVPGTIQGLPVLPQGGTEDENKSDSKWGLGDINYSLFLSPAEPGKIIWGVGPSLTLRTATSDLTGSGKWSAGPTAVVLIQPKPWSMGILGRQLWSFAGSHNRDSVSQFLVQPFANYNLDDGWFLFSDPTITANWKAGSGNRWTVPLGAGVGRLFKIGGQAINTRAGAFYNIEKPDRAPDWTIKFTLQFLFPK